MIICCLCDSIPILKLFGELKFERQLSTFITKNLKKFVRNSKQWGVRFFFLLTYKHTGCNGN